MSLPATISPLVLISWDGSGDFDGAYDDVTGDVAPTPGISIDTGMDGARTLSPPQVVAAEFELYNHTGTYSQERPDSPVYQLVLPGRAVKLSALHGAESAYDEYDEYDTDDYYDGQVGYSLARTAIDDIAQETAIGRQRVKLSTLGIEGLLLARTVTVAVMVAPRVDECITALLDAAGWPSDLREIAVSDTTLTYWWCDDREPWAALLELLASEGPCALWADGDGVLHFENRNYRTVADRATTSQATFYDRKAGPPAAYDEYDEYDTDDTYDDGIVELWFLALNYDPGYRNIRNRATYTTRTRTLGSLDVAWTYGASLTLSASESVTLIARPTSPFQDAVTPTAPTDYTVSGGTVSVLLSATSGLVAYITITATSGTPIVSDLQLRAKLLTTIGETTVSNSVDASDSIAKFSPIPGQDIPRALTIQGWPEISRPNAVAVCDAWINRYQEPRPAVEITLMSVGGSHVYQMLNRLVSDRITLVERNTGLAADVWINSKRIEITGASRPLLTCVLGCEKVENAVGGLWDTALWDSGLWGV